MTIEELTRLPGEIEVLRKQIELLKENMGGKLTRCYTIKDAAEALAVAPNTVRELMRSGQLEYFRMTDSDKGYRITNHAIDKFIEERSKFT